MKLYYLLPAFLLLSACVKQENTCNNGNRFEGMFSGQSDDCVFISNITNRNITKINIALNATCMLSQGNYVTLMNNKTLMASCKVNKQLMSFSYDDKADRIRYRLS